MIFFLRAAVLAAALLTALHLNAQPISIWGEGKRHHARQAILRPYICQGSDVS